MNTFENYNPISIILYFLSIILISMFISNPLFQIISFVGALSFYITKFDGKEILKDVKFYLIVIIIITITNPLFSQNGKTVIYKGSFLSITLESLLYGLSISVLLITVMLWFKIYNKIMSSEKSLYLFSKFIPKTSVIISISMRFSSLLKSHVKQVKQAQKVMGMYSNKSMKSKLRSTYNVFYSTITWMFENALDTSSSMNARGYGINKRTNFSMFKFALKDFVFVLINILLTALSLIGVYKGQTEFEFYPQISSLSLSTYSIISYISFMLLALLPFIVDTIAKFQWKYYMLRIK